jgi:hypothetical protein
LTTNIFHEIHRRNRILSITGWIQIGALLLVAVAGAIDTRTVTGINPWIKPAKFYFATTTFVWTIAWFLAELRSAPHWLGWAFSAAMLIENFLITMQAARGVSSHFNVKTPFDAAVFSTMGAVIALNTVFLAWLLILFFTKSQPIARGYLWGIRFGLLLTILGSFEGAFMAARLSHAVGAPDGGPGLPFIYWSTTAGDLRIAHFFAIHALQLIPLFAWFVSRRSPLFVTIFSAAYTCLVYYLFQQAMHGMPLLTQLRQV